MNRPRLRDRLRDVPTGELRRMAKKPMTPFERQDVSRIPGRGPLRPNERWLDFVYINNRYSVQWSVVTTEIGEIVHLWVRRHDKEMPQSWGDLQRIKNKLVGAERIGVQVFPAQSELVDCANMAHLWIYPEDWVMPFSL